MTTEEKADEMNNRINKMVKDSIPEIEKSNSHKWAVFSGYLYAEKQRGNTEFRIVIFENDDFYIHSLGKDGETLDGNLFNPEP